MYFSHTLKLIYMKIPSIIILIIIKIITKLLNVTSLLSQLKYKNVLTIHVSSH